MLYRTLQVLDRGKSGLLPVGLVLREGTFSPPVLAALLRVGAVAAVVAPPLAVLPHTLPVAPYIAQLAAAGITHADQFVEATYETLALAGLPSEHGTLARWQADVIEWLVPPQEHG